jgi:tripartite-type tricarboxylate transporter receptor subunit TctC
MREILSLARNALGVCSQGWMRGLGRSLTTAAVAAMFVGAQTAGAQEHRNEIFAKKTITIYIGNTAGGSYDLYGRLAGHFIARFIPGNPTVVVQNMPGAGSLRLANFMYNAAPKDGTALAIVVETVAIEQALANSSVQYDARNYTWIGRLAASAGVHMMWHTSKVQSLEDAKKFESLLAGTGTGSLAETIPTLLNALIETKFKIVRGYPASNEAMLAMERGEVEGVAANLVAVQVGRGDWLRDRKVKIILQDLPARRPDLPDVPALGELGDTTEAKQLFRLYTSMGAIGRSIFAPPGVPSADTQVLREAFSAMVRDPEFIQAAKQLGGELEPATGEELQQAVAKTLDLPTSALARARAIFAR